MISYVIGGVFWIDWIVKTSLVGFSEHFFDEELGQVAESWHEREMVQMSVLFAFMVREVNEIVDVVSRSQVLNVLLLSNDSHTDNSAHRVSDVGLDIDTVGLFP